MPMPGPGQPVPQFSSAMDASSPQGRLWEKPPAAFGARHLVPNAEPPPAATQPEPRSALMEWPGEMRPEEEKKASAPPPLQPAAQPAAPSSASAAAGLWRGDPPAALWQQASGARTLQLDPNDSFWSQAGQAYLRTISAMPAAPWSSRKSKEPKSETPAPPSPPSPPSPPRDENRLFQPSPTGFYGSSQPAAQAMSKPAEQQPTLLAEQQPTVPLAVQPAQQPAHQEEQEVSTEKQPAPEPVDLDDPAEDSDGELKHGLPAHEQLRPVHHHTGNGADDILSRLQHITAKLSKMHHSNSFVHVEETAPVVLDPLPVVVVPEVKPRETVLPQPSVTPVVAAPELFHHDLWDAHAFPVPPTRPPTPFPILPEVAPTRANKTAAQAAVNVNGTSVNASGSASRSAVGTSVVKPVAQPALQPMQALGQPPAQPAALPALQPAALPAWQPAPQPAAQPIAQSVQPAAQPIAQSVQPAAQPIAQSVQPAAVLPASPSGWTKDWSSAPTLTAAARAHVAAQTAFRANQADASSGLAAALSGTVPQQLRPSPLFEDLAARPIGTTTAVKLFHGDEIPAVGATANPSVTAPRDEANVPPRAGQMVWSTPQNLRQPVVQPPPAQPAPQPAAPAPPAAPPTAPQAAMPQPAAQPAAPPAPRPVSAPVVPQALRAPQAVVEPPPPRAEIPAPAAPESVAPSTPSLRGAASMEFGTPPPPASSGRTEEKDVESALAAAENVQVPLAGDADDDWMEAVEGAETA